MIAIRPTMPKLFAVALLAGALGACTTAPEATTGALVGGASGAIIGSAATGTTEGAVVGGALGAAGGALVGQATAQPRAGEVRCGFDPRVGREVCYRF